MAEFKCPLYDPVLDKRYELGESANSPSAGPTLSEVLAEFGADAPTEVELPATISVLPADVSAFHDPGWLADLTRQAAECGYKRIGDFIVPEFMVAFRAFHRDKNVVVLLNQHPVGLCWFEINIFNADGTVESWCSFAGDDLVPPWQTRVVRQGTLLDLHDMMSANHARKPPAQLSIENFPDFFRDRCLKEMAWRRGQTS
jgi:hypothetical protein